MSRYPRTIRGTGGEDLPCYFGRTHPGSSCTAIDTREWKCHIILSRILSEQEWQKYTVRCDDQAWDNHRKTWNLEGIAALLHDITGERGIIEDIETLRKGEWISLKR